MNTKTLSNKKVWSHKPTKKDANRVKKAGRIHAFVFHPNRAELVGFLIKRPDIAWMFRRDDMFVAHNGFLIIDDDIIVKDDPEFSGKGALKALSKREGKKISLDDCVIWFGLPVMTQSGSLIGYADSVEFDEDTGKVISLELTQGATANAILGRRVIPAEQIKGFKRGVGAKLANATNPNNNPTDQPLTTELATQDASAEPNAQELGAIIVADEAARTEVKGGAAEAAGQATAVAKDKAKRTYRKVVKKVAPKASAENAPLADIAKEAAGTATTAAKQASNKVYNTVDKASDATARAVDKAGDVAEKGAYAAGKQVARATGMFSGFASAFKDALNGEGEGDDANEDVNDSTSDDA